ncbi:hypothetical protein [Candidatus Contendibacter odensensis]|uniref:Uncharacterized protein n=1 Tax=Candidatus Contendobacter odensis Run_B_J11 TaxID=1400861 RepID=A0A7U7J5P8_9GAMM|nr:hypothetical protein [Candidatus Contendobacter odensis]CDH46733.1 hypothetical protein BN874_580003 [Candidatus Contendobacter odensis Run_B_J11]
MRRNPLWGALPLMAQMLGRKLGVKVEIGGDEAYTDGQTIHLPGLPLAGKPLEILANGFIDHEAAHVRYTDFTIPVPPGLAKLLTNLLEDIRIEQALGRDYPGSRHNLAALVDYLEQNPDESTPLITEPSVVAQVLDALHQLLRARVLRQGLLAAQAEALEARLDALLPEGTVIKLLALAFEVRHAASTTAVRDLALRIVEMLKEEEAAAKASMPPAPPDRPCAAASASSLDADADTPRQEAQASAEKAAHRTAASGSSPAAGAAEPKGSPLTTYQFLITGQI